MLLQVCCSKKPLVRESYIKKKLLKILHRMGRHYLSLLLTEFVSVSKEVGSWIVYQGVQGAYLTQCTSWNSIQRRKGR